MWATIACFLAVAITYGLLLAVYRLTIHPLAKFPGPKLAAATKWWEFYKDNLMGHGGLYAFEIEKMHEDYGIVKPSHSFSIKTEQVV